MRTTLFAVVILGLLALCSLCAANPECSDGNDCYGDNNPCTLDQCRDGRCSHYVIVPPVGKCCRVSSDCHDDDDDFCTVPVCNSQYQCKQKLRAGCNASFTPTPLTPESTASSESSKPICYQDSDCDDEKECTYERCVAGTCVAVAKSTDYCCNQKEDCARVQCAFRGCNLYSHKCYYSPSAEACITPPPGFVAAEGEEGEHLKPSLGDVVGAIIGFVILGLLVAAFIFVVCAIIVRNLARKLRES